MMSEVLSLQKVIQKPFYKDNIWRFKQNIRMTLVTFFCILMIFILEFSVFLEYSSSSDIILINFFQHWRSFTFNVFGSPFYAFVYNLIELIKSEFPFIGLSRQSCHYNNPTVGGVSWQFSETMYCISPHII